jgi:hypothetical protein
MPRSSINRDSVDQVCDEVYISTGKDPIYEDTQKVLGGSNSTIKRICTPCWRSPGRRAFRCQMGWA